MDRRPSFDYDNSAEKHERSYQWMIFELEGKQDTIFNEEGTISSQGQALRMGEPFKLKVENDPRK
ncbi:hypothetical protein HAX54_036679, partial [Datura stramonium]|nr:hypothetical protein [Datura stramonium]